MHNSDERKKRKLWKEKKLKKEKAREKRVENRNSRRPIDNKINLNEANLVNRKLN